MSVDYWRCPVCLGFVANSAIACDCGLVVPERGTPYRIDDAEAERQLVTDGGSDTGAFRVRFRLTGVAVACETDPLKDDLQAQKVRDQLEEHDSVAEAYINDEFHHE